MWSTASALFVNLDELIYRRDEFVWFLIKVKVKFGSWYFWSHKVATNRKLNFQKGFIPRLKKQKQSPMVEGRIWYSLANLGQALFNL